MKKILALVLAAAMVFSLVACAKTTEEKVEEAVEAVVEEAVEEAVVEAEVEEAVEEAVEAATGIEANPNWADMELYPDQNFDVNKYYNDLGVDCDNEILGDGPIVNVVDNMTTALPKADENYTIGFSIYYTVDEVGAMILDTMQKDAAEMGVNLLVNDANYDQNAQNQAIEQWIVEGVDAVILFPCDFYAIEQALDALYEAGIPCFTGNPYLAGKANTIEMSECVEQGAMAAKLLIDDLKAKGSDMKGKVVLQTLPFVHPNAATRAKGFKDSFAEYPDIEVIDLTGTSPEEHYTAFEGAIMNYGKELIGGFGLYSSATIGMLNANKASGAGIPITSIDNDKYILEAIYNDECLGSCCYSSIAPADWLISTAVNYLNGCTVPRLIFASNINVTKDNVEEMFEHYYPGQTLKGYMESGE